MLNKKVCMMGAFSVGKTSLVERYVHSIFSDNYISTIGVKISKKQINVENTDITMVLWDLEGKDDFIDINITYLKGTMGFFVVADLSRKETLNTALKIRKVTLELIGDTVPNILILNKADIENPEITNEDIAQLLDEGISVIITSAKTGKNVEDAFISIAGEML